MDIHVVSGAGEGQTLLSSFDAALRATGVHNYNLIYLSSIIPPGSKVVESETYQAPVEDYGQKLYVVRAEAQSDVAGTTIGAGVGWYQLADGRGMFVEHELTSVSLDKTAIEQKLRQLINQSLQDLCQFRQITFDSNNVHSRVMAQRVGDRPKTVVAIAAYRVEKW